MEYKKLGDIATYINGYPFKPEDRGECGLPIIRIQDLTGNTYDLGYYDGKYPERIEINNGDILISWSASLGVYVWNRGKALLNQHIFKVVFDKVEINKRYFVYAVHFKLKEMEAKTHGATMKHIVKKDFDSTLIPYPSLKEQSRIAEIIDSIAKSINMRQKQLQKLDDLIKARFVELFGDPKLNDKGWNAGIVSDYYEVKGGKRIPKGMGYADGVTAHPYLRATDMKNETILDDDIHYIDEEVYALIKRYTVKSGDVYLTNVGVNLGMAGVIPEKYDGANLTENAVKLVPKTEKVIDGVFLAHYINSPGIQDYINERKMSVGVPKLAIFRIETMPLLLPPMDIQMQFIEFCKQTDKAKALVQKALNEAQLLFDSLMQKYFG